jgi:hypothetical protein
MWGLKLSRVFDSVCEKTSQTPKMVSFLTLRFQWGGHEVITLRRDDSEQQWEGAKEKIKMLFTDAKLDHPSQRIFEFWVKGGGETCAGSGDNASNGTIIEDDSW